MCDKSLQGLQPLSRHLIRQDMCTIELFVLSFSLCSFMDADHGDAHGPGRLSNGHLQVRVIGCCEISLPKGQGNV